MSAGPPANPLDIILLAGRSRSREEFFFTLVNRSVIAVPYDRASVWTLARRPRPLAVSGNESLAARAPFVTTWSEALARLKTRTRAGILDEASFAKPAVWKKVAAVAPDPAVLWLPMPRHGAALLVERWQGRAFSDADAAALTDLAAAYEMVGGRPRRSFARLGLKWALWLVVLIGVAAALYFVRLPLRVVANCEVTARNPRLISAPMDGVVDEVLVTPGQRVKAGDRIAVYDPRLMEEELKVSQRQVAVVEAELAGVRARSFSDARSRGEISLLEARLEQEQARLEALEVRFSRRVITAPVDGMVQLDDARAWRGRPVSTGQAVLWLVDPDDTRVTLWLPQDDRIDFDVSRPIFVHLHAMGGEARPARLTYVSSYAQRTPDGGYAFPAEADWEGGERSPPLGLRGSASIYGQEATLGYWLLRRPLAWFRRWLGV